MASEMKRCEKFVGDLLMQDQSRAGDAGLALIVENRPGGAAHRRRNGGVGEDDIRAFAAKFELHLLEVRRRGLHDAPPRRGRAGKGDFLDVGMLGEPRAGGMSVARHDIDDARRKTHFFHQFGDA